MIRRRTGGRGWRLVLVCGVTVGALALSWLAARPVRAVPPIPSSFWGTVRLDGANAPEGTLVSAWSLGRKWLEAEVIPYDGAMLYDLAVSGDDPDTVQIEGPTEGAPLQFRILARGLPVVARETATWQSAGVVRLDLTGERACVLHLPLATRGHRPPGQH